MYMWLGKCRVFQYVPCCGQMLHNLAYQEKANQLKQQFFSGLVELESFQYADLNEIVSRFSWPYTQFCSLMNTT